MKFSLDLPRETLSVPVIRRILGDTLRGLGVSDACVADILVAISEACTNVVQHADSTSRYEVTVGIDGGQCVLKVVDRGQGFGGETDKDVHPDSESGRGIKIMKALVDDVSFDSRPESGTVVYLQKRLSWEEESPIRLRHPELLKTAG
ncbi:MAG TPA: ATP-binding protein [Actinoallomurus sp.]|nr:ATP-binding protein [Actinoallomurus sp.]